MDKRAFDQLSEEHDALVGIAMANWLRPLKRLVAALPENLYIAD